MQQPTDESTNNPDSGDPIDMATGAFLYAHEDLRVGSGTPPFGLTLERSYSSAKRSADSPFATGWTHNFAVAATEDSSGFLARGAATPVDATAAIAASTIKLDLLGSGRGAVELLSAMTIDQWLMDQLTGNVVRIDQPCDGRRFVRLPDGSYNPPPGSADRLEMTASGYRLTDKHGLALDFATLIAENGTDTNPRRTFALDTWSDRHGNRLAFTYDATTKRLDRVETDTGKHLAFRYDADGRIEQVSDHAARAVSYAYDADGNLASFTNPLGHAISYCWADGRLTHLSALGQALECSAPQDPYLTNSYDSLGRVATQTNASGNTWTYRFAGSRSEEQDPLGHVRAWEYNARGKLVRTVDALGNATTTAYDGQDRVIRITRPEGDATSIDYDARHNPIRVTQHPKPGSPEANAGETLTETFSYEPTYDRILSQTDARGFTTDYVYDADGDSDLDRIKQPAVLLPDGTSTRPVTRLEHNARGQLTETIDPEGRVTRYDYDPDTAELRSTTIDPAGLALTTSYGYDALGNLVASIDPRGNRGDLEYDSERRLTRTVAPLGAETRIDYDTQGRPVATHRASGDPNLP